MAKYDYCSGKEFTQLVRECFMRCVDVICAEDGVDSEEAFNHIKGITLMAYTIIDAIEDDKDAKE